MMDLITEIKSWIGTPARNFSRGKGVGTDCAYFLVRSLQACGLLIGFDYRHTSPVLYTPAGSDYVLGKIRELGLKEVKRVQPGTIMAFRTGPSIDHLGIYVGDGLMVTCTKRDGVIECPVWFDKLAKAFEVNK